MDAARPLKALRILEIGCGTGSSTVALMEQGAEVVGIDVDEPSLTVARDRCGEYGLSPDLRAVNGDEILTTFGKDRFDAVIYFACLEHMTVPERLASLTDTWAMLPSWGLLVIIETPNRLWFYDDHTAFLPFYHWLPDDLAFQYSRFSQRLNFKDRYTVYDEPTKLHFLRRGRGMSYHELDVAIGPEARANVISSLRTFHGLRATPVGERYKRMLSQIQPKLHPGFLEEYLDIIIRKP